MRGYYFFLIWIMALAVTMIAYADKEFVPVVDDKPAPKVVEKDYKDDSYVDYSDDDDDYVKPEKHFSLYIGGSFGQSTGCLINNCGSFQPIRNLCGGNTVFIQGYYNQCSVPQPQVVYQNVYVGGEAPGNFIMSQPSLCNGGCGGGGLGGTLVINSQQQLPPGYGMPHWAGLQTRVTPFETNQPTLINLPAMPTPTNLPLRDGGHIDRMI